MTTSGPQAESPDEDPEAVLLSSDGGGPAVATGTPREQAEQKPAVVRDSASAEDPAPGAPTEE